MKDQVFLAIDNLLLLSYLNFITIEIIYSFQNEIKPLKLCNMWYRVGFVGLGLILG